MTDDQRSGKEQADALRESAPPSKKGDISGHTERPTCPNCGKTFRVEVVVMLGWKDKESVDCPHCGTMDAYSESCWCLTTHKQTGVFVMVKRVDCPICQGKNSVEVRRADAGNVIGYSCECGITFNGETTTDVSAGEFVHWGLQQNPDYRSTSPDKWTGLVELQELEKNGVKRFLGRFEMFREKPPTD